MDRTTAEAIVDAVESAYPDAFRTAVYYEVRDREVAYETFRLRDDVAAQYEDSECEKVISDIVEEAIFDRMETEWHERLHDSGPIYYSLRVFREVTVVHFGREPENGGFIASVDTRMSPFVQHLVEKTVNELE